MHRYRQACVALTWFALACNQNAFDPGVPLEIGQGCTSASVATGGPTSWKATVYITQRNTQTVTGKNGVQVTQTLLSCLTRICQNVTATSADQAISICYNR